MGITMKNVLFRVQRRGNRREVNVYQNVFCSVLDCTDMCPSVYLLISKNELSVLLYIFTVCALFFCLVQLKAVFVISVQA